MISPVEIIETGSLKDISYLENKELKCHFHSRHSNFPAEIFNSIHWICPRFGYILNLIISLIISLINIIADYLIIFLSSSRFERSIR